MYYGCNALNSEHHLSRKSTEFYVLPVVMVFLS